MTESEWLSSADPVKMLTFLMRRPPRRASERKFRLFAIACCRRIWKAMPNVQTRRAVEAAEQYVEGLIKRDELKKIHDACDVIRTQPQELACVAARCAADASPPKTARASANHCAGFAAYDTAKLVGFSKQALFGKEQAAQADLLRCIIGNPFQPLPVIEPDWLQWKRGFVLKAAEFAYAERNMPEGTLEVDAVASALVKGGCDSEEVLGHLKTGPHVRGCHIIDLLLGKE